MSEDNKTNTLDTVAEGLKTVAEVTHNKQLTDILKIFESTRGSLDIAKEKVQTHLYLEHLHKSVEGKGDGHIQIPKVSTFERDAEFIHIPDVIQNVLDLLSLENPIPSAIINTTNYLINMLIGEDVKGLSVFLSDESKKAIALNSYDNLVIARNEISQDLETLRSIEENHDKWIDKMKLSVLYTAFDKAIFDKDEEQKSNESGKENYSKKSDIDKKLEYLEKKLQPGDILYLNEPNEKKSLIKNLTVNLAKPAMVDASNSKDFTSIHAAVYVGNGKIRHIQRGDDGKISKKELSVHAFFTENEDNNTLYASISIGRLHLSKSVQEIFSKTVIEKSDTVKEYSVIEALNAGVHGLVNSETELDTSDTSLICTDLPRMSAQIILENLDENNTIKIDKKGFIVRKNIENLEEHTNVKISNEEIKELENLVHSNGTFQMFSKFSSPLSMNIKDFSLKETTEKFK